MWSTFSCNSTAGGLVPHLAWHQNDISAPGVDHLPRFRLQLLWRRRLTGPSLSDSPSRAGRSLMRNHFRTACDLNTSPSSSVIRCHHRSSIIIVIRCAPIRTSLASALSSWTLFSNC
ncbi:unnamed protein product [Cuscuta epithymum]|uniref:Uncharacterized protein n=1 Tax=Cuscuta epithymum TaxID=186058 RepID=A0AAV0FMB5_9ASTE|nr:unnamed protein product [Cuscuta epithymum]